MMSGVEGRAMILLSAAVMVLVLVAGTAASPRKFAQEDQYEQQPRRDRAIVVTEHADGQNNHQHRFNMPVTSDKSELQVGCAEGAIDTESNREPEVATNTLHTRQKRQTQTRDRRNYLTWRGNTPASTAVLTQTYQLSSGQLPFWVPVWGNPRRIPVFFPAKPILFNPGYPAKNKPTPETTEAPTDTKITIGGRINIPDDRPIWGIVGQDAPAEIPETRAPPAALAPAERPRKPLTPPLLHRPSLVDETLTTQGSLFVPQVTRPQGQGQPVTQRPQPPQEQIQPVFEAQTQTTRRPEASRQNPVQSAGPNRCVWAIISCCSPASQQVRSNCFEQLGCPGSFWDVNPCSREITAAALNAAQMFYDQS